MPSARHDHGLLLIVVPQVLPDTIRGLVPIKYWHAAVHEYQPIFVAFTLSRQFHCFVGFHTVSRLINDQIYQLFFVTGFNNDFEPHNIIRLIVYNQDSPIFD